MIAFQICEHEKLFLVRQKNVRWRIFSLTYYLRSKTMTVVRKFWLERPEKQRMFKTFCSNQCWRSYLISAFEISSKTFLFILWFSVNLTRGRTKLPWLVWPRVASTLNDTITFIVFRNNERNNQNNEFIDVTQWQGRARGIKTQLIFISENNLFSSSSFK